MSRAVRLVYVWVFSLLLAACGMPSPEETLGQLNVPAASSQVLLVLADDWNSPTAVLRRMERADSSWRQVGDDITVRIGRNGLGWGEGINVNGAGPQKQEGDGRSPAGAFYLGDAFGYASQPPAGTAMPYRVASERDYFVDAVDSPDYNHWVSIPPDQPNTPEQRWRSFERMHRDDHQYEFGVVVGHNQQPTVPGKGSAIFLHVWLNPETSTSGCTAMSRDHLLQVLAWLKPEANPLLIQLPQNELPDLLLM